MKHPAGTAPEGCLHPGPEIPGLDVHANLANDSLTSILHRMKIPVDMDNALSRAMACICGLSWLENLYPISSYGIPLSAILAGALQGQPEEVVETREEREAREEKEANTPN